MVAAAGVLVAMIGGGSVSPPIPFFDGHALRESCADRMAYYAYGRCAGFVIGVHDDHVNAGSSGLGICVVLEEGMTPDALVEPVMEYLEHNPERMSEPASALVVLALQQAHPCG